MNIDIVLPKRSSVYRRDRRAISSRYGSAAGESSAMKSLTLQWLLPSARRTSVEVMLAIRSVVSSQLILLNSSENIFPYSFLQVNHHTIHCAEVYCPKLVNQRRAEFSSKHQYLTCLNAAYYGRCGAQHGFARVWHLLHFLLVGEY